MRTSFAIARTVIVPGTVIILRTLLAIATRAAGCALAALAVALRCRAIALTANFTAGIFRTGIPFRQIRLALTLKLLAQLVAFAFLTLAQLDHLALMTLAEFAQLLLGIAAHFAAATLAAIAIALRRRAFAIATHFGTLPGAILARAGIGPTITLVAHFRTRTAFRPTPTLIAHFTTRSHLRTTTLRTGRTTELPTAAGTFATVILRTAHHRTLRATRSGTLRAALIHHRRAGTLRALGSAEVLRAAAKAARAIEHRSLRATTLRTLAELLRAALRATHRRGKAIPAPATFHHRAARTAEAAALPLHHPEFRS